MAAAAGTWGSKIAKSVDSTVWIFVPIEVGEVILRIRREWLVVFCCCSLPTDLVDVVFSAKDGIHDHFQIVTRRRVTMKVDTTRRLQNAPKFVQSDCHHNQIRHY